MAFLRTILIIFIIYYVIRFFIRFVFPSLLFNYMGSKMKNFTEQQQQQQTKKREGEVSIDYAPPKQGKNKRDKGGEYIDYVEVKD